MKSATDDSRTIFLHAVENIAPDKWPEYLDDACGENQELRDRVERLLRAHQEIGGFMSEPVPGPVEEPVPDDGQNGNKTIGQYKIREKIGEGFIRTVKGVGYKFEMN